MASAQNIATRVSKVLSKQLSHPSSTDELRNTSVAEYQERVERLVQLGNELAEASATGVASDSAALDVAIAALNHVVTALKNNEISVPAAYDITRTMAHLMHMAATNVRDRVPALRS